MLAVELAVLRRDLATLGGLLDRQRDPPTFEVDVDDLHPELLAGGDDLFGCLDMVRGHLGDVHQALDALADLHERAERHQLGNPSVHELADLVAGSELLPRVLLRRLQRERDALAGQIDVEHLHDGRRVVDVLPRQLRDVDQTVHAAEVDERTEVDHRRDDALADLAGLQVGEELVALLALRLLEVGPARQHDVVAVLVELDDLALEHAADVRVEVADAAQVDERRGQEAPQADVDDEAALDDFDDRTGDDFLVLLLLLDRAPRALVLRALLRKDQATVFVLFLEDERFDLLAQRHDLVRVDVVADRELLARDDALGLVSDVEQHLVGVDLDDFAVDEITIIEGDDRGVDGVFEGHAVEVVDDDVLLHLVDIFRRRVVRTRFGFGGGGLGDCGGGRRGRVRFLIQHLDSCFVRERRAAPEAWAGRAHIAAPVERPSQATAVSA